MHKEDCFCLGNISKTYGLKGEVIAKLNVVIPANYTAFTFLFIQLISTSHQLTPFPVQKISMNNKKGARISLEGITTVEEASQFIGKKIYLPLDALSKFQKNPSKIQDIVGYKVFDKQLGYLGFIEEVLEFPHQSILQIKREDKEILIPAVDEFIIKIDRNNNSIEVSTPDGLVDIYT